MTDVFKNWIEEACERARIGREHRAQVIQMARAALNGYPRFEDEVDDFYDTVGCSNAVDGIVAMGRFRHGPLSNQAECDEWVATTLRKLPRGSLAYLYRMIHNLGVRLESAEGEERQWRKTAPKV